MPTQNHEEMKHIHHLSQR